MLVALVLAAGLAPAPAAASPAADPVSVRVEPTTVSTGIGQRFSLTSTVRNDGDRPLAGLVAHLNVLGLEPEVYVDPEDWSSERTKYLDPLPAHTATRLTWTVQAVNPGRLVVYVAVTTIGGTDAVAASNALRLAVAPQRTVEAGGILPLAVAMPTAVLLLTGLVGYRRRRLR
jgi:hypothetical protein